MCSIGCPRPRSIASDIAASNSALRRPFPTARGDGEECTAHSDPKLTRLRRKARRRGARKLRRMPHVRPVVATHYQCMAHRPVRDAATTMSRRPQNLGRSTIMAELTFEPPTIERFGGPSSDPAPTAPPGGRVDAVNVCRVVDARQILQDLSLSVEPGELVAIAGGSGAGKTTLLEILAGLQPPSTGQVR